MDAAALEIARTSLDMNRAPAFAGKSVGPLNDAMLELMVSIGHRTELFDRMSGLAPSMFDEIAQAARLDERYVREWLATMVTGGIVGNDDVAGV